MITALLIAGLIMLNGLFVLAEFAIIGASKVRIESAAHGGSGVARRVLDVLRDSRQQDRYIATAQLGITFASLGLGMYGEHAIAGALLATLAQFGIEADVTAHGIATVLAVGGLTYLHIVLGEIVPKAIALQHAEAAALRVSRPMAWTTRALWPLVLGFEAIGGLVLRGLGVRRERGAPAPTTDALRFAIEESVEQGELDAEAGTVLEDLFAWSERSAAQVMVPRIRVVGLSLDAPPEQMRRLLRSAAHSRYPVYDGTLDRIVGMVLARDVLRHLLDDTSLSESKVRPIPFVPATARLDLVLTRMRQSKTQMVVVMDELGGTSGILTTDDLFAEMIGSVNDGDARQVSVYEEAGELRALGKARIEDVGERLGLPLVHPDVDTVSGLVLAILNRPPVVGDVVVWEGIEVQVRSVEGRGVKAVVVRRRVQPESA